MNNTALIIEASDVCKAHFEFLVEKGFTVEIISSIEGARKRLDKGPLPDLLLLDAALLEQNEAFLKEIRTLPWDEGFPIIPVSDHPITKRKAKAFGLRLDDCLFPPFDLTVFGKRLKQLTDGSVPRAERKASIKSHDSIHDVLSNILQQKKPTTVSATPVHTTHTTHATRQAPFDVQLIKNLLFDPVTFMQHEKKRLTYQFSLILIGLFSAGLGVQTGIQKSSIEVAVASTIGLALVAFALTASAAWILHWVFGLKHKPVTFQNFFNVLSVGWLPLAYACVLGLLYIAVSGGAPAEFTGGLLLFFPTQSPSSFIGFILRRVDFFEIWGLWTVVLALVHVLGFEKKLTTKWVFGVWTVLVLIGGLLMSLIS